MFVPGGLGHQTHGWPEKDSSPNTAQTPQAAHFPTPTWSTLLSTVNQQGQKTCNPCRQSPRVRRWGMRESTGVESHVNFWEGIDARHTGSTPMAGQEQRPASVHLSAGLLEGAGRDIIVCGCILTWRRGTHGNAGMWVTFPQLLISAAA